MAWRWARLALVVFLTTCPLVAAAPAAETPATAPPPAPQAKPVPEPEAPVPAAPGAVTKDAAPAPPEFPPAVLAKVAAALENAMTLVRPGQIGLATVWDGNAWVQCRHMEEPEIRCEAAGTAMQPSLVHVLTLERAMRLAALAWTVDPRFGNYIHIASSRGASRTLAREVLRALGEGYGADPDRVEVRTTWVRDGKCPPRAGPGQNLAGSIDDTPAMARTALRACLYGPAATGRARSVADLFGLYGLRLRGEVQRLIVNRDAPGIHLVLNGKVGYVQCAPEQAPPAIYCEAASGDAVPSLVKLLTPDRVARLHAMGFADPGRAPNYWRNTPLAEAEPARLVADLLTILYEVYGYRGDPLLRMSTEKGS